MPPLSLTSDEFIPHLILGSDSICSVALYELTLTDTSKSCLKETKFNFKAGSHDAFFGSIFSLALFQLIEMLVRVSNFFEFE